MSQVEKNVSSSFVRWRVRLCPKVPLTRLMRMLVIAGLVLAGSLYVEKRWAPVRGVCGVVELARLEKNRRELAPLQGRRPVIRGRLVAHAGGGIDGNMYVNSIDAIEANYRRGHRAFEVDLSFTSDGALVLQHHWGKHPDSSLPGRVRANIAQVFQYERRGLGRDQAPTLAEFQATRIYGRYQPTTWEMVAQFLRSHPDAWVITDTKYDNEEVLSDITRATPGVCGQVIPQIYSFSEYPVARRLGFSRVILTLYKRKYWNRSVIAFAASRDVSVTMPWSPLNYALGGQLTDKGVEVFFHSVNDPSALTAHPRWKYYTFFIDPALDGSK
jgi:glycerophosphoryl diester phosphodiesterase